MSASDILLASLNSGEVSRLALARIDLAKLRVACEQQENWLPHVLGPCQFRPGTQYIAGVKDDLACKFLEFTVDAATKALGVLTPLVMRILLNDAYLTRALVTAVVTNGGFDTNLTGWGGADEAGAVSDWVAGGFLRLTGTGTNYAFRDQQVTVVETGTEHALRVVINHGTVVLKVGTAAGDNSYLDVTLAEGNYSLAFTPTGNFWIRLGSATAYHSTVDSIQVEGAGIVELPTPWGAGDLANIFYDQSEDVLFCSCIGFRQRRVERRAANSRSWGVAMYYADDGPFRLPNLDQALTLTPGATTGFITLAANRPHFRAGNGDVGGLRRLVTEGQSQTAALGGANQFTGNIRVSGLASHSGSASSRGFAIDVNGTFVATVTLQRSLGSIGAWNDVESYTAPTAKTYDDGLDNQIAYYRLGIKPAAYTSGTATATLTYAGSVQTGICRIVSVADSQNATADVLTQFGAVTATSDWSEGEWSPYRGFPAAVALHEGGARVNWGAGVKLQMSISDAYASFDDSTVGDANKVIGDAGPLNRTITTGGRDGIRWLLSLQRLIAGTALQEVSIRASAFDEPITPTAFVARACSNRGAARIRALKVDQTGIFVGRDGQRVYELVFAAGTIDYQSKELTRLKQEMCAAGVRSVAVQRQPDTRLWYALNNGACAVLVYEPADDVSAWVPVTTPGSFEEVAVLPGTDEDDVYFSVARTVNGATKRFIEKLSKRSECVGGFVNKTLDCHVVYSGAPTTTVTAAHLPNTPVVAWAMGLAQVTADAPVTTNGSGVATLPNLVSSAVTGLPYTGRLKTVKLAYGAEHGSALTMPKRIAKVGLLLADVVWKGLRIGRDFNNMTSLPATYHGRPLLSSEVISEYDDRPVPFPGGWDPDSRVCLQISSPYAATIKALVLQMETAEPNAPTPPSRGGQ